MPPSLYDAAHPILRHEPCALQTANYASYSTERGERLSGTPPVTANIVPAELNALSSPVGTVRAYVTLFYAPTAEGVDRLIDGFACRVQCSDDV